MNFKKKYKKDFEEKFNFNDKDIDVSSKFVFNKEPIKSKKKTNIAILLSIISSGVAVLTACAVGVFMSLNNLNKKAANNVENSTINIVSSQQESDTMAAGISTIETPKDEGAQGTSCSFVDCIFVGTSGNNYLVQIDISNGTFSHFESEDGSLLNFVIVDEENYIYSVETTGNVIKAIFN